MFGERRVLPVALPLLPQDLELVRREEALREALLPAALVALVLELLTAVAREALVVGVTLVTVQAREALAVTPVTVEPETTVMVAAALLGLAVAAVVVAITV